MFKAYYSASLSPCRKSTICLIALVASPEHSWSTQMAAELHVWSQETQFIPYPWHFLRWEVWLEQNIHESNMVRCE